MAYKCDSNFLYMFMQRGDSSIAPNKHRNIRIYNGMLGYLDPEYSKSVVLSDFFLGEACVVKVPMSWLPDLKTAVQPYESVIIDPKTNMPAIGADSRRCKRWIDPQEIAPLTNTSDFLTKFHKHRTKIDVIDGTQLSKNLLKDTALTDFAARAVIDDVGQITIGNFTVGAAGDYPNWGGVGNAWVSLGNLTGNLTFTQISNVIETATATGTITIGGFILDNTSNNPHNGDPTIGWTVDINFDGNMFVNGWEGPGTFLFHELHSFYRDAQAIASRQMFGNIAIIIPFNGYIYNLLMNQNTNRGMIFYINEATPILYFYNIVGWGASQAVVGTGFWAAAINADSIIANICMYANRDNFNLANQGGTYRNNTAYDSLDANSDFLGIAAAIGRHNLSSDGTAANPNWTLGVNNAINTAANLCVQTVNPALPNFMDILEPGALVNFGEANAIARATCIRNRVVPNAGGGTSIGPAEILPPIPPPPTVAEEYGESRCNTHVGAGIL